MMPEVSGFILGLLDDTDKHIEVADGHYVPAKQKAQVRIEMCNDTRYTFIATLHDIILAPYISYRLLYIITIMNLGKTLLFIHQNGPMDQNHIKKHWLPSC